MNTDLCKVKKEVDKIISGNFGTIILRVIKTLRMVGTPNKITLSKSTNFCFAFWIPPNNAVVPTINRE
jgi:hypothetical protein